MFSNDQTEAFSAKHCKLNKWAGGQSFLPHQSLSISQIVIYSAIHFVNNRGQRFSESSGIEQN